MIKKGRRRLIAGVIALVMLTAPEAGVSATSDTRKQLEDAKEEREATQNQKEAQEQNISNLEDVQSGLQGELSTLNSQLAEVGNSLEQIENNIIAKKEEIETAQAELADAKATEERQYLCLKKRIQYSYEKSSNSYLEAVLSAKSLGEVLNMTEYFSQMAAYDQKMLAAYKAAREAVEEKEAKLEADMDQLEDMQASAQAEHERFSGLISQTRGNIAAYSDQIASAEAQVEVLEAQIAAQDENIAALQKKLEEEIRKSRLAAQSSWRDISEVSFSEDDRYLLANLIYCEAGGEPYEGQVAVGAVVINRVLSSVFPNTVSGVIYQSGQFEPVSTGRLALALAENRATDSCYRAADEAMSGVTNVGNCVFFRTPIPGLEGINIGGHVFY